MFDYNRHGINFVQRKHSLYHWKVIGTYSKLSCILDLRLWIKCNGMKKKVWSQIFKSTFPQGRKGLSCLGEQVLKCLTRKNENNFFSDQTFFIPMIWRTSQSEVFWPLQSNSKVFGNSEDSQIPISRLWMSSSHSSKSGVATISIKYLS